MAYDYDVIVIGLGSAGMAVSTMATHMGLKVLGIDERSAGMPDSNALRRSVLRMAHSHYPCARLGDLAHERVAAPASVNPFARVIADLSTFEETGRRMIEKLGAQLHDGTAAFVDPHTVSVEGDLFTAKKIFVCVGTRPSVPAIPGLKTVDYLTSETAFALDDLPESLIVIGGGSAGCEMAQAFSRLGCRTSIVHPDPHLLSHRDRGVGKVLEEAFAEEGIRVYNARAIRQVVSEGAQVALRTDHSETFRAQHLLIAAGRRFDFASLSLEKAGIEYGDRGIRVDGALRTCRRHIYAPGECNGTPRASHSAGHQGMIALMNATLPGPFRFNYRKRLVPWALFTAPPVAHVGALERDLRNCDVPYETIEESCDGNTAGGAEGLCVNSVQVYVSGTGRIHGVSLIGEGAGEAINEWGLAIQNGTRIHRIMLLQHSSASMSSLAQRASQTWMLRRMANPRVRWWARRLF